jgi:hypothetical protein
VKTPHGWGARGGNKKKKKKKKKKKTIVGKPNEKTEVWFHMKIM